MEAFDRIQKVIGIAMALSGFALLMSLTLSLMFFALSIFVGFIPILWKIMGLVAMASLGCIAALFFVDERLHDWLSARNVNQWRP